MRATPSLRFSFFASASATTPDGCLHTFSTQVRPTNKVLCVVSPPPGIEVTGSSGSAANTTQRTRWTKPRAVIWGLNLVYNPAGRDHQPVKGPLKRKESGTSDPERRLGYLNGHGEPAFECLSPPDLRLEDTPLF